MSDIYYLPAVELARKIARGEISSLELTEGYIDRIATLDERINAVPVRTFERAISDARRADEARARGQSLGPLHGVPMTIKESYVMAGTPATWGLEAFRHNVASEDGLAVQRFRAAGAHFLGKTNVPADLADFQSYNSIYGTTNNPRDLDRTPGGSSGGSAAAIAAGMTALEAGSDIGGSIRNPAHFNGVFGHKPTWGVVPQSGHELIAGAPDSDLSVCGPIARDARDLKLALSVMSGPTAREAIGWKLDLPAADITSLGDFRVAVWHTDELAPVSSATAARVQMVADCLAAKGAVVSDTARPDIDFRKAHDTYQSLLSAVMSSAQPSEYIERLKSEVKALRKDDVSPEAVNARAAIMMHRDWLRLNFKREKLRLAWDAFFSQWDILICPQMATSAFPHDHRPMRERVLEVDGVDRPYFEQLFWSGIVTAPLLPSTVFPTGLDQHGLPIGLQAVSGPYRDYRCIEFARLIVEETGGFEPPVYSW